MESTVHHASDRLIKLDSRSPVRFVGLLSLLAVAFVLFRILWPLRWSLIALWVAVEFMFYIFYWRPRYAELNKQPTAHKPKAVKAMKNFERCIQYFRETPDLDTEMYYTGWFCGAQISQIKRGNLEEFLAYAFWYSTVGEMRENGQEHYLSQMIKQLDDLWGLNLQNGYTPGLQFMGHLKEPLKAQWRPLLFYMGTETLGWFARHLLERWGFRQHTHMGLAYFTLNMRTKDSTERSASGCSSVSDASVASALSAIASGAEAVSGAVSSATSAGSSPAIATTALQLPEAAMVLAQSSPAAATPQADSASTTADGASSMARTKSSPFEAAGIDWAAKLAADADFLAASITAASAVHGPAPTPAAPAPAPARKSFLKRRSKAPGPPPVVNPYLSSHTSIMLKNMPNPLEDAFHDELGAKDMPVLFLHGVGGLPAYLEMILQVMALGHPLIIVQFNAVAMRLSSIDSADDAVDKVIGMLDKLGVPKACVIGHSYGTFVAGRLARLHCKRVHSLCLIDPVVFGMFMPQLLSNFLYKAPEWKGLHHAVEFVKRSAVYIASHELHVCATFSRNFFWSDLNLWPEDLRPGSVVLLSGRDDLMNAEQVKEMLQRSGHIKVHFNKELSHGEFLVKSEVKTAIMEELRGMLARSGSAVVGLALPVLETTMTLARTGLGALGAMPAVRMHHGHGGKYVEDHANQLVRTFTGNLTAMLHTVNTFKPTFDIRRIGRSSSSGGAGTITKLSRMAPGASGRTTTGGVGVSAGPAAAAMAVGVTRFATEAGGPRDFKPAAMGQALPATMSLPISRKTAKGKWIKSMLDNRNASPASSKKHGLPEAAASGQGHGAHSHSPALHLPKGVRLARRTSSKEGRRSSGSGTPVRKIVTMNDGVEIMQLSAGKSIPEGPENSI